jgi:hypothetical protein
MSDVVARAEAAAAAERRLADRLEALCARLEQADQGGEVPAPTAPALPRREG